MAAQNLVRLAVAAVAGAIAIACAAFTAGSRHARSHLPSPAPASMPVAAADPATASPRVQPAPALPPTLRDTPAATTGAPPSNAVLIPLPPSMGGGKIVSPETRHVAERLGLLPEDLTDVAAARGGTLSPEIVRRLDGAYAEGQALGERLGVPAPMDEFCGGRFANQLVRIDREMRRSPPSTKLSDVVDAVTRDTLGDLRKNAGDEVANAAQSELAALSPL